MISLRPRRLGKRTSRDGWISPVDGFATRPCRVFDMTERGATVNCADEAFLTNRFRLKLQPTDSRGRLCEIVSREGPEATVRFVE